MRRNIDQLRQDKLCDDRDPTRAKPDPWFVGNGQGLMIAVLATCAVLIALRLASFLWLAETAWSWWTAPPHRSAAIVNDRPAPSSPPRRVPPTDPRKANARIKGNPGLFFGADAYPADAIRADEQGRTVADLLVDATGSPIGCTILTSSGSRSLDAATCSIAIGKVRFDPARDARGVAKTSHYTLPVRWVLPSG